MMEKSLSDLNFEAVELAALLEGTYVLSDMATMTLGEQNLPRNSDTVRARNSLGVLLEEAISRAYALADEFDRLESEEKKNLNK